jgi:hypothetical protein
MKLSISLERVAGPRYSFSVPRDKGELMGEVDDSATSPLYAVQHCVVDTSTGEVVLSPTQEESRAQEVAARLNRVNGQREPGPGS